MHTSFHPNKHRNAGVMGVHLYIQMIEQNKNSVGFS